MAVSLYQAGISGLLAAQQQLSTTGHNIANVNTEGYSRQRVEQSTLAASYNGDNFLGAGTYVSDIARVYDQFAFKEQLYNQTALSRAESLATDLDQLNEIMSSTGDTLASSIENFYQTMNGIADNPTDLGLRNIVLSQADILARDFNTLNRNLEQIEKSSNVEIEEIARKITDISYQLANINGQVLQNQDLSAQGQPNDLLDKRDQLLNELAQYTNVTTVKDNYGVMTVMIGSGATLVAGITPLSVSVSAGDPDASKTQISLNGTNSKINLTGDQLGGALSAKFEFRDQHLTKLRNEIDRIAMAISDTLNQSQQQGLDLDGNQGLDLFTDINTTSMQEGRVLSPSSNAGSLTASVEITDLSLVPTDDFEIRYDGTNYVMTNLTTGTVENLGAPGSGAYVTSHGFTFNEDSGAPASGDKFIIDPTKNSAALMKLTLTEGRRIAASLSVEAAPSEKNVSNGAVKILNVTDPVAARNYVGTTNNSLTVDVYESAPGVFDYRVFDPTVAPVTPLASGSFTAGNTALINMPPAPATTAFQIEISGSPKGQGALAREEFSITDAFGQGNGNNATLMALTHEKGILNKGRETFTQSLAMSTSVVGGSAKSAELVAKTADALYVQAYNRNQETSGVNLDEEAANLLRFQQAYQASSQIISVANTIFDTLLAAAR